MSLLPGEMIPQSVPLGKVNADGSVTISTNYWLLLYNIALNSIGTAGAITDASLEELFANQLILAAPAPVAQPVQTLTVTASPFTYTAPFDGAVSVIGPMESASSAATPSIVITRQGTAVNTGLLNGTFPLRRADEITVTYVNSVAPTMTFLPA